MSDLLEQIRQHILEKKLLLPQDRIVVAVSGGVDSIVLLRILVELASECSWKLCVAHFNHLLRGENSDGDEHFVRQIAENFGLPCKVGRENVKEFARVQKLSLEMAARKCRHKFLGGVAKSWPAGKVALAHHADDQVELFFLKLFRGAGPEGLAGMKALGRSPHDSSIEYIRPLLEVERSELLAFAKAHRLEFREDESNKAPTCERNRLRLELLPQLRRQYQPNLNQVVIRLMKIMGAESEWMARSTESAVIEKSVPFNHLDSALQRRYLRSQCFRQGLSPDFDLVEHLRVSPGIPRTIQPGVSIASDEAGTVQISKIAHVKPTLKRRRVDLNKRGTVQFEHLQIHWNIRKVKLGDPVSIQPLAGLERFDAQKVGRIVRLRHWQAGDRFQPIGLPQSVKVQDLFTNLKVPREIRTKRVVAETAKGEIFWIEGLRIANNYKILPRTRTFLEWRWISSATKTAA